MVGTAGVRSESLIPGGGAVRSKSSSEVWVEVDGVEAGLEDSSALSTEKREFRCNSFSLRIATSSFASKASGISARELKVRHVTDAPRNSSRRRWDSASTFALSSNSCSSRIFSSNAREYLASVSCKLDDMARSFRSRSSLPSSSSRSCILAFWCSWRNWSSSRWRDATVVLCCV